MYVLKEDAEKIRKSVKENPRKPIKEIQPLTFFYSQMV